MERFCRPNKKWRGRRVSTWLILGLRVTVRSYIGLALDSIRWIKQLSDTFHLTYVYRLFCGRCQVLSFASLTGLLVSFVNLY